ncbi:hypothetical protein [Campylobacter pinnipediorum]|uniref:Uncharacterized protein n=1 Tax=Campylobacter pinnipediorum subsp. pinnipediorum TaxID=1660067 RepID=A0AAX0L969_9BACT|nr:hypothetical protein [Campylobacter pinnipediorum]AQW81260.1 hypothetical protein CPIN17260_0963 [Campylobacter pinnipediorum subsp. pinnipediorum]AQW82881.1 hypothetical protein CPIN17261_0871 [Campylobacter pinnipediorum subsp. pinnipediorum]OPA77223.1 hypothetical protein BFG04_03770 [Campylobacter pinnipediorum subsp. pinnipediorum]
MTQINWISSKVDEPKISRALLLEEIEVMFGYEVIEMINSYGYMIISRKRIDELRLCYHELVSANQQGYLAQFRESRCRERVSDEVKA